MQDLSPLFSSSAAHTVLGIVAGLVVTHFLSFIPEKSWLRLFWIVWLGGTFLLVSQSWKILSRSELVQSVEPTANPVSSDTTPKFEEKPEFGGLVVKQRVTIPSQPRTDEIEIEVYENGKRIATAKAINVDNECSWGWDSSESFVDRNGEGCDLQERLSDPLFVDRFDRSYNVVFVGLDSYAGKSQRNSLKISDERALTLAKQAATAYPDFQKGLKRGWVVGLGRATIPVRKGSKAELRQRAAVIVGVATDEDWPATKRIILAILNRIEIGGLDFSSYDHTSTKANLGAVDMAALALNE